MDIQLSTFSVLVTCFNSSLSCPPNLSTVLAYFPAATSVDSMAKQLEELHDMDIHAQKTQQISISLSLLTPKYEVPRQLIYRVQEEFLNESSAHAHFLIHHLGGHNQLH